MSEPKPGEVTALLEASNNGEQQALDELAPLMRISKTSGVRSARGGNPHCRNVASGRSHVPTI